MLEAIAKPFGWLLKFLYEFTGNYGIALILFALVIKLILLPFMIKSKKSTLRTARLTPKMKELEKKHGANKQKYNEEVQKLYREEGINPMSGCIWTLIPFPILLALYYAIRYPVTIMMGVGKDLFNGAILDKLTSLGFTQTMSDTYVQIEQAQFISNHFDQFKGLSDKLIKMDFSFLGMDLGQMPNWKFWKFDFSDPSVWLPQLGIFLIPVLAAVLTYLSSKIASKTNPAAEGTEGTMKTMNLIMPIMTLWFGFIMPAAVGVYWASSMLFGVIQDIILNKTLGKSLAIEEAKRNEERRKREAELEEKRKETERLRAQNATMQNKNTSKRKQQMQERLERDQKSAEWEKTHVKKGKKVISVDSVEEEPSRVGDRPYARGRAYDPNRYSGAGAAAPAVKESAEPADEENETSIAGEAEVNTEVQDNNENIMTDAEEAAAETEEAVEEDETEEEPEADEEEDNSDME